MAMNIDLLTLKASGEKKREPSQGLEIIFKSVEMTDAPSGPDSLVRYSDLLSQSFVKKPARVATTGNIANTATGAPNVVDGASLNVGDRILVWQQSTQSQNGIYVVDTVGTGANGVWSRALDFNESTEMIEGSQVVVKEGSAYADTLFVLQAAVPTVGTSNVIFAQTGGGSSTFLDSSFRIQDDGDNTKQIAFQASGISTGQTRTITMPDFNVDLENLTDDNIAANGISGVSIRLANEEFLRGRDAGDTNDISLIKVDSADRVIVGDTVGATHLQGMELHLVADDNVIHIDASAGAPAEVRFYDSGATEYVQLQAPSSLTSSYTLTFPLAQAVGSQILANDGSGNLSWVSPAGGAAIVRVASATQVDVSDAPASIDGVTLSASDKILLFGQTLPEENGIYEFVGENAALVRHADWDSEAEFAVGKTIYVTEGAQYFNYVFTVAAPVGTLETDPVLFSISGYAHIANDTPLSWRNSAGTGYVNIKVGSGDSLHVDAPLLTNGNPYDLGDSSGNHWQSLYLNTAIWDQDDNEVLNVANRWLSDENSGAAFDFRDPDFIISYTSDFRINGAKPAAAILSLGDADNSNRVSITVPSVLAGDYTLTLPVDDGNSGQVLSTNGSGVLSWVNGASNVFADNVFRIQDNGDATKQIAFEADQIDTATTRTITMANQDINLAPTVGGTFANAELSNLGTTAVNVDVNPGSDDSYQLGSNGLTWGALYVQKMYISNTGARIQFDSGGTLQTGSTVKLDWSGTDVSLNTRKLTNVVDPTADQDAATKNYVDDAVSAVTSSLSWREACIAATTDAGLNAAADDTALSTLLPFSDDESPEMVIGDFNDGDYILSKNGASSKVFRVWDDGGTLKVTTVGVDALASGDAMTVVNDLPATPATAEGIAIYAYDGTDVVRVASLNFNVATGIQLASPYTPTVGTIAAGNTLQQAIEKLDATRINKDGSVEMDNGAYLKWRDSGDTSDINILALDSNTIYLGPSGELSIDTSNGDGGFNLTGALSMSSESGDWTTSNGNLSLSANGSGMNVELSSSDGSIVLSPSNVVQVAGPLQMQSGPYNITAMNAGNDTEISLITLDGSDQVLVGDVTGSYIILPPTEGSGGSWVNNYSGYQANLTFAGAGLAQLTGAGVEIGALAEEETGSPATISIYSATDSTLNTGSISIDTGAASVGNSGGISMTIGSAGGTQGEFKFLKSGVASVVGQVWTASDVDGTGYWADATGGGGAGVMWARGMAASNLAATYDNGTAGVGATLTADANGNLSVDGLNYSVGDLILVQAQTATTANGLYEVTDAGSVSTPYVLTRVEALDETDEMKRGVTVAVLAGDRYKNTLWILQADAIVGSNAITFEMHGFDPGSVPTTLLPYGTTNVSLGAAANRFNQIHALTLNAADGNSVLNFADRTIQNVDGVTSADFTNLILTDTNFNALDWQNRTLHDSAGNTSLEWLSTTELTAYKDFIPNGDVSFDLGSGTNRWSSGYITDLRDGADNIMIQVESALLNDTLGEVSINWESRELYDSAGNVAANYNDTSEFVFSKHVVPSSTDTYNVGSSSSRFQVAYFERIHNSNDDQVIHFDNLELTDPASNQTSVNWGSRTLNDSDGDPTVNWESNQLSDGDQNLSIDWSTRNAYDVNAQVSVAYGARQLYDDSSNIMFTWGGAHPSANSHKITDVTNPTDPQDAATKAYVDAVSTGLDLREAVFLATTGDLDATYNNGASGVGATLTANNNGAIEVDDFNPVLGQRVLVKDQTTAAYNGIYTVTQVGDGSNPFILTRATDYDQAAEVTDGTFVFVQEGTVNADRGFVQVTFAGDNGSIMGTTAIEWTQFSAAGSYTFGDGLVQTGNTVDIDLATDSGLYFETNQLAIQLDGTTLVRSGSGLSVNLNAYGLENTSSGISLNSRILAQNDSGSTIGIANVAMILAGQPEDYDAAVDVKIADPTAGDINQSSRFVVVRGTAITDGNSGDTNSTERPITMGIAKEAVAVTAGDPLYLSRATPGLVTNVLTGFQAGDDVVQIGVATSSALSGDGTVQAYINPVYLYEY